MELIEHGKLLFSPTIDLGEFGVVHQPTLRDFLNFDYYAFKRAISIRKDAYIEYLPEDDDDFTDFEFLICMNCLVDLINALKILYRTDEIELNRNPVSIVVKNDKGSYRIDRDNYTRFADLILILLHEGNNIKNEEEKRELDEIEKKMERKRREFERKKAKREAELKENEKKEPMTIFDIANYVMHVNDKFNYQNILDLTIYQLINTYSLYFQKEKYNTFMMYKTSGNFKIEDEVNHWFFNK